MDLAFTEDQESLRALARQILSDHATEERLRALERRGEGFDADLWEALARAGLLGFGIEPDDGGNGGGLIEVCVLLEQAGRATAPVPLWSAATAALAIARFGSAEQRARLLRPYVSGGPLITVALEPDAEATRDALSGSAPFVSAADRAAAIVVPVGDALYLLDPSSCVLQPLHATSGAPLFSVAFDRAPAERLSEDGAAWLADVARTALCAMQVGVAERTLRLTADYTSEREQFGRPLATFQAVQQRAADCYIDVEAMRWTMWQAAWRLSEGLDAASEVAVAKFFAAEGGERVLAASQHLHGGIGVDLDYPLHRCTFLARDLALTLGGANAQLARLGEML